MKRSFLECQPTFAQSWPLFHAFLGSLPSPVALIAHNGLRFDFRVLLAELRRTNLLHTHPIPSNVVFLDSYIAFGNIEKKYLDDLVVLSENMNWKLSKFLKCLIEFLMCFFSYRYCFAQATF